jgi:hypothetical protein
VTSPTDHGAGLVVASVDRSLGTVTFTTNPTAGVGSSDFIFRAGAKTTVSGATSELTGIQAIVNNTGTLFNVDPSSVAVWRSTVSANGGTLRAATDNLFEQVIDEVYLESGQAPDFIITSPGVRRNYAAQLKAQKRFADTTELKGGFSALTIDAGNVSLPLAVDRDAPNNRAFLIHRAAVTQHQSSDWEFMEEDGAVLSRVSGEDAYEAVLFKYHELTTDRRNVHARIDDLIES